MRVGDELVLDVVLEEDRLSLDEVVVVGYGVQEKKLSMGKNERVDKEK